MHLPRAASTLSLPLLALVGLLSACATFQDTSGKFLASTALTVDAAMKGWATWVVTTHPPPPVEATVRAAYVKYQASMAIACNAYTNAITSGDRTGWQIASDVLQANQIALVNLISSFESIKTNSITP